MTRCPCYRCPDLAREQCLRHTAFTHRHVFASDFRVLVGNLVAAGGMEKMFRLGDNLGYFSAWDLRSWAPNVAGKAAP